MKQRFKPSVLALTALATLSLSPTVSAADMSKTTKDSLVVGPSIVLSGMGIAVHGSAYTLVNGGKLIVKSAKQVGENTVIVLKHASTGAETVLETSGEALGELSQFTGHTVEAIGTVAGTIIADSAKVLLFIPTRTAHALFETSEYREQ